MWFSTYYAVYPTAHRPHQPVLQTGGSSNYTGYSDPEVDRLTARRGRRVDETARDALLAQVEQRIGEQAPCTSS